MPLKLTGCSNFARLSKKPFNWCTGHRTNCWQNNKMVPGLWCCCLLFSMSFTQDARPYTALACCTFTRYRQLQGILDPGTLSRLHWSYSLDKHKAGSGRRKTENNFWSVKEKELYMKPRLLPKEVPKLEMWPKWAWQNNLDKLPLALPSFSHGTSAAKGYRLSRQARPWRPSFKRSCSLWNQNRQFTKHEQTNEEKTVWLHNVSLKA